MPSNYGTGVGGTYPGGKAVGGGSGAGEGYAALSGVASLAGAPFVGASGIAPAVGSGEGAADGELISHPASSASATSNADRTWEQRFIDLPSDSHLDARHSSALLRDCQGILKATLVM
jgi:hypothetical protein